jgi:sugar/nucleoside kinase (ribokinase family)
MKKYDIVTVGQMVFDVVIKPVNRKPAPGECLVLDALNFHTGGCTLNTSVVLAKLGTKVALIGQLGNDIQGQHLAKECRRCGIATTGIKIRKDINTTSCVVMVASNGERCFFYRPGATEKLALDAIDWHIVQKTDYVHLSGMMKLYALDVRALLKRLRKMGKIVSMDVDYDSEGKWSERIVPYLEYLDVFMPSMDEARLITGKKTPEEICRFLLKSGVKTPVIKLGNKGSFYMERSGRSEYIRPFKVKLADATGAGDAFCGGFLSRFTKGAAIRECCSWGNACGALTVTKIGAAAGIENLNQVKQFLKAKE